VTIMNSSNPYDNSNHNEIDFHKNEHGLTRMNNYDSWIRRFYDSRRNHIVQSVSCLAARAETVEVDRRKITARNTDGDWICEAWLAGRPSFDVWGARKKRISRSLRGE
jgi:hypothetical protein